MHVMKASPACISLCSHGWSNCPVVLLCNLQDFQDIEDADTLVAVEVAVRESTSVKIISVKCHDLHWTNVATAILKGATENRSLRELTLETPQDSPPPQDIVSEVKQKRRSLLLEVNVENRLVSIINYSSCMHRLSAAQPH